MLYNKLASPRFRLDLTQMNLCKYLYQSGLRTTENQTEEHCFYAAISSNRASFDNANRPECLRSPTPPHCGAPRTMHPGHHATSLHHRHH